MSLRRVMLLAALAASFLLAAGMSSQAAYSYSTAITITSASTGGAIAPVGGSPGGSMFTTTDLSTSVILGNISSNPLIGANTVNIGTVAVNTTSATPLTFNVAYTDVVTITNPTPGGSTGTFTINGVLSLTGVQSSGGASGGQSSNLYSGTFNQSQLIGGTLFTVNFGNGIQNDFFGPPTINGSVTQQGSLGANITPNLIPEPASLALMGTGLVAVLGLGLRRMKRPDLKRS